MKNKAQAANSRMKHTQGNWMASKYSYDWGVYSNKNQGRDIALVREYGSLEEGEANAKLIAAAPDLLEALIELSDYVIRSTDAIPGQLVKAQFAINKATK